MLGVLPESEEHGGKLQHVQTALGVHKKSGLSVKDFTDRMVGPCVINSRAHGFAGPLNPGEALIQYVRKWWRWGFE